VLRNVLGLGMYIWICIAALFDEIFYIQDVYCTFYGLDDDIMNDLTVTVLQYKHRSICYVDLKLIRSYVDAC
jgi:hypothetical protein